MSDFFQGDNFPDVWVEGGTLMKRRYSRIIKRKYSDIVADLYEAKGWDDCAMAYHAGKMFPEYKEEITPERVREWRKANGQPGAWFSKVMEFTLDIRLPPQCYYGVGKR